MKKQFIIFLLAASLLLNLTACGSSNTAEVVVNTKDSESAGVTVIESPIRETEAPTVPTADSGDLHGVEVSIGELEYIEDYFGNTAILIHFTFTNNSEENKSAMFTLSWHACQNGIGLEDAFIMDDNVYDSNDLSKEVQPGATIELADAYVLSSETAPVEFFVYEAISFDKTTLYKEFETAPGGETVLSIAPGIESAVDIDKYAVSINSYDIAEDHDGNPTLILNMGYTNNSESHTPFYAAIDVKAFQDGIELERAFISDKTVLDNDSNYLNVLPGAGHGVAEAFVLTSETSPVDIEVTASFSLKDDKIVTQINLSE